MSLNGQHRVQGGRHALQGALSGFQKLDIAKPVTNRHIAEAYNQLHDCVHDVGRRVDAAAQAAAEAKTSSQENAVSLARVEGALGIRQPSTASMSAGVPPKAVGPKLAAVAPWKAITVGLGLLSGVQLVFQWVLPAVIKAMPSWIEGFATFITSLMAH